MTQPPDTPQEKAAAARAVLRDDGVIATTQPQGPLAFFLKRMGEQHISSAAAALTFSTTLAIVPALALVLAGLAGFPAFDKFRVGIQNAIVNNLIPDTGTKVSDALGKFIEAAGQLTAFGVIGLFATAVLLLLTIEGQLNLIFRVIRPRLLFVRLLIFWAVMTVGPFLLGLGVSLFGYFSAARLIEKSGAGAPFAIILGQLLPSLLTWTVIAFVFILVPNRRVKFADAAIGAAVAAGLLLILRYTFTFYVVLMTSYQAIYGALAAVPVFLVWLYLVWLFVIMGAVVTSALPDWRHTRDIKNGDTCSQLLLGLEILSCLASTRIDGQGWTRERLLPVVKSSDARLSAALELLRIARFVAMTEDGRWVLSRDLERTALSDLMHHFGFGYNTVLKSDFQNSELCRRVGTHLKNVAESERTLLSISLARLITPPEEQPS